MAEQAAIIPYQGNSIIRSYDDAERAAKAMAASGYFSDARQAAQAVVKILAGSELGFGAFASMTGIHIIHDRPAIGANLMAAAVKRSGRYDYRVVEMSDTACELIFFEKGQEIGRSKFTDKDAAKAGTQNMGKFPRNMLFARAISNGVRWYCPDVFNGSPVYTPEELGASVNEDGDVIDAPFTSAPTTSQPAEAPAPATTPNVRVGPASQKMLDAYSKLVESARSLGIEFEAVPPDITNVDLADKAHALKARIAEAEAKIPEQAA